MTNQTPTEYCSNGHPQRGPGFKFCNVCGAPVQHPAPKAQASAVAPPINQAPPQNAAPGNVPVQPPQSPPVRPARQEEIFRQNQMVPSQDPPQAQQIQAPPAAPNLPIRPQVAVCGTCGGDGAKLPAERVICTECRWLRPLLRGYRIDSRAFEWAADAKAMQALRAITPLTSAAKMVSEKVGRKWIESTFNGILLGEKQMPQIYGQAVKAARVLGMTHMPDIYLSGERPWDCLTFGTEKDSFIVIGSAIAGNFQGPDLFFLLAREMGHCQAGHALWQSVMRFLIGEQSQAKGFMAGGIMNALKSPGQLVVNAIEIPLLAWARQAEITADRAGLLCIGSVDIARRVLISWSLRSSFLFRQINVAAWLEQQAASEEDGYSKLSELTTSSTPYLSRRLRLLSEFAGSSEINAWRDYITESIRRASAYKQKQQQVKKIAEKPRFSVIRCSNCGSSLKIPETAWGGKDSLTVKCPNKDCGSLFKMKKSRKKAEHTKRKFEENMNYGD